MLVCDFYLCLRDVSRLPGKVTYFSHSHQISRYLHYENIELMKREMQLSLSWSMAVRTMPTTENAAMMTAQAPNAIEKSLMKSILLIILRF